MLNRRVRRGVASVMMGTMLLTQVLTPSLSNLARAEDALKNKSENVGESEVPKTDNVAETSSEVHDTNKDMLSGDFQPMAETTSEERALSLANFNTVPEAAPSKSTANNIERFVIEWVTPDKDGKPNNLHNVWVNNEEQAATYKITYALSGKRDYEVGTMNIKVPKTIFEDRKGNPMGYTVFGVPKAPDKNGYFAYTEVEDGYILTNTKRLKAASSGVIEASIKGLIPSEIKDFASGYYSRELNSNFKVTVGRYRLSADAAPLYSTVETDTRVYGAYLRHNTNVYTEYPKDWDQRMKPENPDDYYYATFTSYASSQANQYFNVNLKVDMRASEDAKNAVVLGFKNARKDEVILGNGTGVFDKEIESNVYLKDGQNFSGLIYVAYPKRDFTESRGYKLKGDIEYKMVGVDDGKVTTTTDTATLPFSPVDSEHPTGNFYVEKQGAGDVVSWVNLTHREGIYDTALNKLKARQNTDIRFDIQTRAFGGAYTLRDGGDPDNLDDYGHKPYKLVTDDFKTRFNDKEKELTSSDFEVKGLDLSSKPLARKFVPLADNQVFNNPFARKVFTAGDSKKPLFGYAEVENDKIPLVNVYGKVNNSGDWIKYGTVDYRSGSAVITAENGARVEGTTLMFPENVTDFKTEVETTLALFVHDVQEIVTVKASDYMVEQVEELYKSGIKPKTYFANHVKLDVYRDNNHYAYINEYVARDQLHGFAYGIKPEKKLVEYTNDVIGKKVDLSYELSATLQTNLLSEKSVRRAVEEGWFKEQTEGVFYDLLPEGVVPVTGSIEPTRKGDSIVSVKATENYKGSGRTMLEIRTKQNPDYKYQYKAEESILNTKGYFDKPGVKFKARLSWLNLKTYGAVLPNIMAYGSKHEVVGVKGLETETNPTSGKNTYTKLAFNTDIEKTWFTDLNLDDFRNYVYARQDSELIVETSSITSVLKEVDVNNESLWGDGLDESLAKNVYEGGRYSYAITMKNTDITKSRDIVFYDNLEKFKPLKAHKDDYGDTQWRGTFQNVNLDNLRKAGVEPVVYYSTKDNLVLDDTLNRDDLDLTNKDKWSTEMPSDKTKIRAIAIDASKKADGSDFILPAEAGLSATIEMKAPMAPTTEWYDKVLKSGEKETGLVGGAHAYNNIVMTSRQISTENGRISENLLVRHDYVKVGLKPHNIKVTKEWSDDDNRDGLRKNQAVFELVADGRPTGQTVTVNEGTNWSGEFVKVPYSNNDGNPIQYTIRERDVKGYTLKIKEIEKTSDGIHYKVENKHESELVTIKGEKRWNDVTEDKRPKSITVVLKADGREVQSVDVKPERGTWNYEFRDLYKYRDGGTEIKYTVEEKNYITGYYQEIDGYDIVNTYNPYADVVLTKKVVNATEKAKEVNPDFTFVFNLKDKQGNPIMKEYEFETTLGRTGKVYHGKEFTLKADEEIKIKRVDSDNVVTLKEINLPEGYFLETEENSTETLQAGRTMRSTFTNRYEARGTVGLDVTKELTGRQLFPTEFKFSLLKDGEVFRTGSNAADGKVDFGLLEFTQNDLGRTQIYKIREENNARGGITYDTHEEEVRIDLADNGKGKIVANVTYDADGAKFKNEYHATGKVNFKAWKQMLNGFKPENEQFSFEIVDANNQVVATGKNDASGTITFSDINFTEKDVDKSFTFIAREVQGNDDKVIYDNSTINYTVVVTDNYDGTLSFKTTARDNKVEDINNDINSPVFVNKYKDGSLSVRKRVTNGDPNQEFRFKVKLKGVDGTVPKGNFDVERAALDSSGNVQMNGDTIANHFVMAKGIVADLFAKSSDSAQSDEQNLVTAPSGNIINSGVNGVDKSVIWELHDNGYLLFRPANGTSGVMNRAYYNGVGVYLPKFDRTIAPQVKTVGFAAGIKWPQNSDNMFDGFTGVENIDMTNVDTTEVTSMNSTFWGLKKLVRLNLTNFDVSNVKSMVSMFRDVSKLKRLDLSSWNTSKLENVASLFFEMTSLEELNLSGWDTRRVTNFSFMFYGLKSLKELDVSSFDTRNGKRFTRMFSSMSVLEKIDIGHFAFGDSVDSDGLSYLFHGDFYLKELTLPDLDIGRVKSVEQIFNYVNAKKMTLKGNSRDWFRPESYFYSGTIKGFTKNWVKEDGTMGPITVTDLYNTWTPAMAGTWVREVEDLTYNVKFDTGGTGEQIPQMKATKDQLVDLPTPTIRKPNSKFKGWSKTAGGEILTKPIKNLTTPKQTVTLYAVWEELDNSINIANGEFEVSVFGNEQVTLKNLPAGLGYEVYELTTEGWVLVDENNTTGVIKPKENTVATFTNEYRPGEAQAKIQAKKLVDGKAANAKGYRFELVKDGSVVDTVESTEDGIINFKNIRFNEVGTFNYTIREVNDNKVGISYDTSVKNVSVIVTDLGNGKREAKVKYEDDLVPVFNNTTQKTTLEVSKVVQGTDDATKDFNFKVTINGVEQLFTLKNGGKKVIEGLKLGDTYKVEEVNLPDGYNLVSIENAEGTVGSMQPIKVVATNKYNVFGSVELQAKKVLQGKDLVSGQFTFELIDEGGQVVDTAKNDANGNIYFNSIALKQAGIFNYKIREVRGTEDGISYDTHEENVRVVVTDNGGGELVPEVQYDADGAVFTNTYTPPVVPPTVTTSDVTITKKVEGTKTAKAFNVKVEVLKDGKLLENTFNYESSVAGKTGTVVSGGKVEIQGDEVITVKGVPVGATVKITEDDYSGYTVKDTSILEKVVGTAGNDLVLTNVYNASGEVLLSGVKRLVGGDIKDYTFNFLILKDGKVVQEFTNAADGTLNFKPLHYTNRDIGQTYEYEVIEDSGDNSSIQYDSKVYKVTVKVEDNGDGTLKLTTTTTAGDNGIEFNNVLRSQLPLTGTMGVVTVLSSLVGLLVVGMLRRRQSN